MKEIIPEVQDPSKVMTIKIEPLYCINRIKELITTGRNLMYIKWHINKNTLYATPYDNSRVGASYETISLDERLGSIINIDFVNETVQISNIGQLLSKCNEDELIAIPRALYSFDSETQAIKDIRFITFDIALKSVYYNK